MLTQRRRSVVEEANERVSIVAACRLAGLVVPDLALDGRSMKLPCPFGAVYHKDGGIDPSFRIYPQTNTAYCFRCSQHFTPVNLVAMAWDQSYTRAAGRLLEVSGYVRQTMNQRWERAQMDERPISRAALAEALKTFCARMCPDWEEAQFDPEVSAVLARCLTRLDEVSSDSGARAWLTRCKSAMSWAFRLRASDPPLP